MTLPPALRRTLSVARKEFLHMLRDPATVFFALAIPVLELFMLGYAIDTNVRNVSTVVFDQCRTQESRAFLKGFETSKDFRVVGEVFTDAELQGAIVAGKAHVGIKIPEDYSRRLQAGQTAQVLILVDGSESRVAGEALNVGNALALQESLKLALKARPLPVEARPTTLFNPDTRSPNYFIPGLMVVMCQMMATMLTANALVREKENGTLEQLFMTPVRAGELMVGKIAPYLLLTLAEFCGIAFLMRTVFQVPISGSFLTLLAVAFPFIVAMLGLGMWISTRAGTRDQASQMVIGTVMPSIFLSGYVFPVESMPWIFQQVALAIPTTWLIDAARGVILRGAGWHELWLNAAVLTVMSAALIVLSAVSFHKKLA